MHFIIFFFSSRRRHTRLQGDWSSDVCSSDLEQPDAGVHHGRKGFLAAVEQFVGGFEDFRVLVDEIVAHGNQVITYHRTVARGSGSGATFEQRGAGVWTLRNGSIVRVEWFGTQREALKAVGLEE